MFRKTKQICDVNLIIGFGELEFNSVDRVSNFRHAGQMGPLFSLCVIPKVMLCHFLLMTAGPFTFQENGV